MSWTNLTDKFFRFLFLIFVCCGLHAPLFGQDTPFEQLKHKFEEGSVFNAEFHHRLVDSYTRDTVNSSGAIWVGERRYKVRTDRQSVVVNGKTSMVYDDSRNRVIISKYEPAEDDFAPSRILNGVDSTFAVQVQEEQGDQIYIRLTSADPFAIYKKVEIYLSHDLIPQKIRAVDPVDNIITTTFSRGEFIQPGKKLFMLDYPDGAEIVDMRN